MCCRNILGQTIVHFTKDWFKLYKHNIAFHLFQARAGMISTVDVLKVVGAFVNEDDYTVWSDLTGNLGQISILLQNTDGFEDFKTFSKKLYKPVAQSLGWDAKESEGLSAIYL